MAEAIATHLAERQWGATTTATEWGRVGKTKIITGTETQYNTAEITMVELRQTLKQLKKIKAPRKLMNGWMSGTPLDTESSQAEVA